GRASADVGRTTNRSFQATVSAFNKVRDSSYPPRFGLVSFGNDLQGHNPIIVTPHSFTDHVIIERAILVSERNHIIRFKASGFLEHVTLQCLFARVAGKYRHRIIPYAEVNLFSSK